MSTPLPHGSPEVQKRHTPTLLNWWNGSTISRQPWENEVITVDSNVCHTPEIDASIPNTEVMTHDHVVKYYHDTRRHSVDWSVEPDKPLNDSYSSDPLSNNINLDAPGIIDCIYPDLTCMFIDEFTMNDSQSSFPMGHTIDNGNATTRRDERKTAETAGNGKTMIEIQLLQGCGDEIFDEDDVVCRQDSPFTDQIQRGAASPVAAATESAVQ